MKTEDTEKFSQARPFPVILFLIFIFLEICIYLLNKLTAIEASGSGYKYYLNILLAPWLWMTFGLAIIQLLLWRKLLAKSELSYVYSISSLSYPLTMLTATFLFKENLSVLVWIGSSLITLGAFLVGSDSNKF